MRSVPIESTDELNDLALEFRYVISDIICKSGGGHLGGALSLVEIIISLYFRVLRLKPDQPRWPDRDRLVLSKGHAGPVLYTALAYRGFFSPDWLPTLNKNGTNLPSHVDQTKTPGVDMTAGSLGQGLSSAIGISLACKANHRSNNVFCIIGDGESQEGQIWEAALFAGHHTIDNMVAILDYNRKQIDGSTDEILSLDPIGDKWRSFGWEVFEIDGHDWDEIFMTLKQAIDIKDKPAIIIANTIKAKGNLCYEGGEACHYIRVPDEKEHERVLKGVCPESPIKLPYSSS